MLKSLLVNVVFYVVTLVLLGYIIFIAVLDTLWTLLTAVPRAVWRRIRSKKQEETS